MDQRSVSMNPANMQRKQAVSLCIVQPDDDVDDGSSTL